MGLMTENNNFSYNLDENSMDTCNFLKVFINYERILFPED